MAQSKAHYHKTRDLAVSDRSTQKCKYHPHLSLIGVFYEQFDPSQIKGLNLGDRLKSANVANIRKYQKLPSESLVVSVDGHATSTHLSQLCCLLPNSNTSQREQPTSDDETQLEQFGNLEIARKF